MHLVMFDIDGTLIDSSGFEDECYISAVESILKIQVDADWSKYINTTDSGILNEIIDQNALADDRDTIHRKIKSVFINNVTSYLNQTKAREIPGAARFIQRLKGREDVVLAIATGGWEETAKMKLLSAGIDYSNIAFASASDHVSRTGIMKTAEIKCALNHFSSKSYFGDAVWDQKASWELHYNFILVGNNLSHPNQISNFEYYEDILNIIGCVSDNHSIFLNNMKGTTLEPETTELDSVCNTIECAWV
ncbi:MAG: HAD hydrolase-like protein [Desulfobacteraceae bacterium]|nr:HAD hydrolase-like protein [Desulfobacteraceae bacterium]